MIVPFWTLRRGDNNNVLCFLRTRGDVRHYYKHYHCILTCYYSLFGFLTSNDMRFHFSSQQFIRASPFNKAPGSFGVLFRDLWDYS